MSQMDDLSCLVLTKQKNPSCSSIYFLVQNFVISGFCFSMEFLQIKING